MKRILLVMSWLLPAVALAQPGDLSKVQIKATHVAGNVHRLEGAGGNIGVSVGPDGVLIVDDQFAPLAPKIREALGKLARGKVKTKGQVAVEYVLNTHWHLDHTGGNAVFGREGRIVAHSHVRTRLASEQHMDIMGRQESYPAAPKEALPVITFDQGLSLFFNGEEIRLTHMPSGHTDGDVVVHFTGSNVMHLGDLFTGDKFPYIDLENGGSLEGCLRNVEQLLRTLPAGVKIMSGHRAVMGRADLELFARMLRDTVTLVKGALAAGKTLEQVKAEGMPAEYATWGDAFVKTDAWLTLAYQSLGGQRPGKAGQ